jgi:hypothetical protein
MTTTTTPGGLSITQAAGIRRFDDAKIQSAIDNALAGLPADRKCAVVAHATMTGASLSLVVKLGDQWSVAAGAFKPYAGPMTAEADVRWSPF